MQSTNKNRTFAIGLLIILIGLAFLLHQMRLLPPKIDDILISWQMLLIVIGVFNIFTNQSRIFGYILISVGLFFLLPDLFDLPYNFRRNFWPFLLIAVGLFIIFRHGLNRKDSLKIPEMSSDSQFIDELNIFSGSEKRISIKNFRGGRITSIFGGSEIDLRNAELSDETNVIEVFYLFGGSSITVPPDWNVINNVTAILGVFSDKRSSHSESAKLPTKTIIIQGFVMFGGGEIKS
ncbi:MAG: DUF5668 domain-containing protein [Bacteroidales bacterium]